MRLDHALTRKFFQIGYNRCGTTFIAGLFRMNGIPTVHWEEGALAEDIAYAKLAGRPPLQHWADRIVAFTDMESVRYVNMPVVEAFKEYAFLDRSFPGSVFLLNTRRVEDWVASRYMHRGGSYARTYAAIRGVGLADLGDIWAEEWHQHLAGVRAYFGDRPEFVEIDIDQAAPQDYCRALAPFFELPKYPEPPGAEVRQRRDGYRLQLEQMVNAPLPALSTSQRQELAGRIAGFACPAKVRQAATGLDACSGQVVTFDAAKGEIRNRSGDFLPVQRGPDGRFHLDPGRLRWLEPVAAVNDIALICDKGVYQLDMRPACPLGIGAERQVGGPLLVPSRRAGAENLFLWPMPRHHRPGNDAFLGLPSQDELPFDQKLDRAFWRGTLTGYARGDGGPDLDRPAEDAVQAVLQSAAYGAPLRGLLEQSRLAFVAAYAGSPDVDAALQVQGKTAEALHRAGRAALIASADMPEPLSHRYLICLGGAAGPDELTRLANSNSVLLKEEDGWQNVFSDLFRPWQHYIPLEYGGGDLARQLVWARTHPEECLAMSQAARDLCAALADPDLRRAHLEQVLRAYRKASGQPI